LQALKKIAASPPTPGTSYMRPGEEPGFGWGFQAAIARAKPPRRLFVTVQLDFLNALLADREAHPAARLTHGDDMR
jgi:hypothetical protein